MRWVATAAIRPHRCAVIPYIGAGHERGYFDAGSELDGFDNHVYISVVAAEQMAGMLGWASPHERAALIQEVEDLRRDRARLEDENSDLNRDFEAIDLLASKGFQARKKQGRPRKEEAHVQG